MRNPVLTCLDLEGVLIPEIWLAVAERTGIAELQVTTRDIPDYDELMRKRLDVLDRHSVRISDIQQAVAGMEPLPGAAEFLCWLRERCQVIILSDTYYDLAGPLMKQLGYPTMFSHTLEIDETGRIRHYHLRQKDQKRHAVLALKNLCFRVLAAGDSYNDISMLQEAHAGIFYRPPDSISAEYPAFPVTHTYSELKEQICRLGELRP